MSSPIHYRFPGFPSKGRAFPIVALAITGGLQNDAAAELVITDLRGLPETSRTAMHRPTVPDDFGATRGTVIYLNVDAPTPGTVLTTYELPRTGNFDTPTGADLILSVGTSYFGGAPDHISASLGNTAGSDAGYINVVQRISKNSGGSTFTANAFLAVDLDAGVTVGSPGAFTGAVELYTSRDRYGYQARGQFLSPGSSGYVGFRFARSGETHYGFVFVRVGSDLEVVVDYVGWDSTPGVAVSTQASGQTVVQPLPKLDVEIDRETQRFVISWDELPGKTYSIEQSGNLVNWSSASGNSTKTGTRRRFASPLNSSSPLFYRVSVQ